MSKTSTARIERGNTYLVVPVNEREVRFVSPVVGPNTYNAVMNEALTRGLRLPTGEQDAFLLDEAYNSQVPEFKGSQEAEFIRKNVMKDRWLWVPNVNVWTSKSVKNPGLYVVFDGKGQGVSQKIDTSQLEDQLSSGSTERGVRFSKDRRTSFAPLNTIRAGDHAKGTLPHDGAFIANYGVEGAEKLDEVAKRFTFKPYSWVVDNTTDTKIQRVSALGGGWYVGDRLGASFVSGGDDGDGYVFGLAGSE